MLPLHTICKTFAFVAFSSLVFISCSDHSKKEIEIIKALNEGIENSNLAISAESIEVLTSLQSKLNERGSEERAKVWFPKAEKVQQLSKDIFDYIENIKLKFKDSSINGTELFEKLKSYREQVLKVDQKITNEFEKYLPLFTKSIDSSKNDSEKLFKDYFRNTSSEAVIAMLNKIENNVRVNELKLITYCNEQVGLIILDCGSGIASVVITNSLVFKPKDRIEITAGIILFDKRFDPRVFIYDKAIDRKDDGFAHYKLRAPSKPGKYYVPVKINYTDQNGRQQTIQKEIEYTVANIQEQ